MPQIQHSVRFLEAHFMVFGENSSLGPRGVCSKKSLLIQNAVVKSCLFILFLLSLNQFTINSHSFHINITLSLLYLYLKTHSFDISPS